MIPLQVYSLRREFCSRIVACLLATFGCATLAAQEVPPTPAHEAASPTQRPRIGLVLSGGGARGAAHIGVLKVLEELHIQIDAIAGTSMGAIVGGLYASGYSVQEIERIMTSIDWQDAFQDRPLRSTRAFRRKQDDQNFLVRIPLGLKGRKFLLPKGLIQGQKLNQMLRGLTLPIGEVARFDDLPIPFRAVAADIETGQAVVMDRGDLATAMRASMSAPGLFAPAEINGRLLVDGGIAENLPIDVARSMGVDRLIVVDVSFPLLPRAKLTSAFEISNQMLAILVRRDAQRQRATLQSADVVIEPALGEVLSADFRIVREAISKGEAAAQLAAPQLAALSVDSETFASYQARRVLPKRETPRIDFVRSDERSQRYEKTIAAALDSFVGQPLDVSRLEEKIGELYALDNFETLDYRLVRDGARQGLEIQARRKSWGPNYVRFGLNLQDDFEGNNSFNAAARFILTEINSLGAEWTTDLQVGENPRFYTELYQPLTYGSRFFLAPHVDLQVRSLQVLDQQAQVAEYRVRTAEMGFDFGREFGNWGELRAGVLRGAGQARVRIGDPSLPPRNFETGELFLRFAYDKLDNVNFPRRGQSLTLQWNAARAGLGDDQAADLVSFDWLMARSLGRHTLVFWTSAGSTLDRADRSVEDFFSLGGFLNLSGITPNSISGPHFGLARLIYYRQIGRSGSGFLDVPVYAGVSFEVGNVWQERHDAGFGSAFKDGSLFLGLDTFLGPLYLAGGFDDAGQTAFYLFLGRTF